MRQGALESQECFQQGNLHLHVEVRTQTTKHLVVLCLECQHNISWHLLGLLLAHALEGDRVARRHAPLHSDEQLHALDAALLPRGPFNLLLHDHRPHLHVPELELVRALHVALAAAVGVAVSAAAANDLSPDALLRLCSVVEVLQRNPNLQVARRPLLHLLVPGFIHELEPSCVVEGALLLIIENVVRFSDRGKACSQRHVVLRLVGVVRQRQLAESLLDRLLCRPAV
mmetsp:Transcript_2660/g.6245  ORF Transcript_2660/g.6245 Transcript_2660/m.6245 type:complete len:228 (-) Transcript_2660:623-1306(-)